jgi:hypothetical protein
MNKKAAALDLLIRAVLKLDALNGERQNVLAFIRSCYCGRVGFYDLELAVAALTKLTDEEEHALIAWIIRTEEPVRRSSVA